MITKTPVCMWPCKITKMETKKKIMGSRTKKTAKYREKGMAGTTEKENKWKKKVVIAPWIHKFFLYLAHTKN